MKIKIEQIDAETCSHDFADSRHCMIAKSLERLGYENVYVGTDKVFINITENFNSWALGDTPSYEIANGQGYLRTYTDSEEGKATPLCAAYDWKEMREDGKFVPFEIEIVDLPPLEKA